ncbi:hypothetical protein [Cellulophaga sp. Hel_I_12]|uniref:hypothetical protein n=1 Tax=Cellulophaga sp. Hel_I_12 TaxID=1249972 RepID=UPI00064861FE|nr:hypothetical protein [Cellulophaga sp. Hel_I_12]
MKKLVFKISIYTILLLIALEIWVRVFHLAKDTPNRYLDENKVEKWMPNQNGYAVTGNRRQNFSAYHINASGYNSYREFNPSREGFELALVGDSFIEGFHQNYYQSIGKKIENKIPGIEVYEYGYAGYDMADQLHLIHQYRDQFKLIDLVVLGLKYNNDLTRPIYEVEGYRLALESPLNNLIKKSKLLVYGKSIGVFSPIQDFINTTRNLMVNPVPPIKSSTPDTSSVQAKDEELLKRNIENLESLMSLYGFDKEKFYFLIDETVTPTRFIQYLNDNRLKYITIGEELKSSAKNTTLIYDHHWNNNGREIVAQKIAKLLKNRR